jgi:selenide, water dikinase
MGPCDLDALMSQLPPMQHPSLLVGAEHGADAGVYQLRDDLAVVQSVDFFPPNLADPYSFGLATAANALSDIYAMGATPITALNLLATPKDIPSAVLLAMLNGAAENVRAAGAVVCGGHTILSKTVMFGLSVTGVVNPVSLIRNTTPRIGDVLVLTKPLGTGVGIHAVNAQQAGSELLAACVGSMSTLNKLAGEAMAGLGASAATDITGFGLLGHALDMLSLNQVAYEIKWPAVPLLPGVAVLALAGNFPGGSSRNCDYTDDRVDYRDCPPEARLLLNDAQTSGGLLLAIPEEGAQALLALLTQHGYALPAAIIGRVTGGPAGKITVKCQ